MNSPSNYKIILLIVFVAMVGIAAVVVGQKTGTADPRTVHADMDRYDELKREIDEMRAAMIVERAVRPTTKIEDNPSLEEEEELEETVEEPLEEKSAQDGETQFRASMEKLADRFVHEVLDPAWKIETEQQIEDVVTALEFEGSNLLSAHCRSSMCKVEVAHEGVHAQESFLQKVASKEPFNTQGRFEFIEEGEGIQTRIYIARRGTRLED